MSASLMQDRVSRFIAGRRRRIRIWLGLLTVIIIGLGLRVVFPDFRLLPGQSDAIAPWALLGVFLVALICEYVDSSLGMGYGTTLTPLLLLAGFEPLQIVPCILLSECVTGLAAGLMHHRDGNIDLLRDRRAVGTLILLSALSTIGTVAAVTIALSIPRYWLTLIIAVIILSIGVLILATAKRQLRYRRGHIIAVGAVAAFNKGLSGGGYGPLVTAGQVVSGLPAKHAVAITSLAESLTCAVGLVAYLLLHRDLDFALAVPLTLGAILSVPMATLTVRSLPEGLMRIGVGAATCLLGVLALAKLFI